MLQKRPYEDIAPRYQVAIWAARNTLVIDLDIAASTSGDGVRLMSFYPYFYGLPFGDWKVCELDMFARHGPTGEFHKKLTPFAAKMPLPIKRGMGRLSTTNTWRSMWMFVPSIACIVRLPGGER